LIDLVSHFAHVNAMYNSFFFFCSSSSPFPPPPSVVVVNARQDEQECRCEFPLKVLRSAPLRLHLTTHPRAADDAKLPEFAFVFADLLDKANRNKENTPRFIFIERACLLLHRLWGNAVEMNPAHRFIRETYSR